MFNVHENAVVEINNYFNVSPETSELCELFIGFFINYDDEYYNVNMEFAQQLVSWGQASPKLQRFALQCLRLEEEQVLYLIASLPNLHLYLDLEGSTVVGNKHSIMEKITEIRKSSQPQVILFE